MTIEVTSNEKPAAETESEKPKAKTASPSKDMTESAPEGESHLEQNESGESDTQETEVEESETDSASEEGADDAPESEDGKDETEKDKPRKKGGFQRRIDKLNAAKAAAQQEAEYWRRLALEKSAGDPKTSAPKVEGTKPSDSEAKPKPDDFETHAEYVEALTDWKVDQKDKTRQAEAQKSKLEAERASVVKSYNERKEAFVAQTPDFDDVIEAVDGIRVSPAVSQIILESENGPLLAYELAKDPEEFERICNLPPLACAREMGKFESKLAAKASEAKLPETKKITKAPKPIAPVTAGGKGSVSKSLTDPNLSQSDYEKLRREQMKKRRQA